MWSNVCVKDHFCLQDNNNLAIYWKTDRTIIKVGFLGLQKLMLGGVKIRVICLVPDVFIVSIVGAVDKTSCTKAIWWDDSSIVRTVNRSHPQTDGTTCCTVLWSSHAHIDVNAQINPLFLVAIQTQCTVHLTCRILIHVQDWSSPSGGSGWIFILKLNFVIYSLYVLSWCNSPFQTPGWQDLLQPQFLPSEQMLLNYQSFYREQHLVQTILTGDSNLHHLIYLRQLRW